MAWATEDNFTANAVVVPLNVLIDGRGVTQKAKVTVREVPGGNVVVFNNGGVGVRRRTCQLYVPTETDLQALQGLLGAAGVLSWWEGSVACVLEEVDSSNWWDGGQQQVKAAFIDLGDVVPPV